MTAEVSKIIETELLYFFLYISSAKHTLSRAKGRKEKEYQISAVLSSN